MCLWIFTLHLILFTDQVLADVNLLSEVCAKALIISIRLRAQRHKCNYQAQQPTVICFTIREHSLVMH